jgi:multiple sugar transport system substrate-binding protein
MPIRARTQQEVGDVAEQAGLSRQRVRPPYLALGAVAVVIVLVAGALAAGLWLPGSGPGRSSAATPTASPAPVEVRWFVGLGGGTLTAQVEAERTFVAAYDRSQSGIVVKLDVVDATSAYDILKSEIASGNPPDIVGPVGFRGMNGFGGLFLDLADEIASHGYDTSVYEPAVARFLAQGSDGQVGLPYLIYPGFIFYNRDLLRAAGLPDLPTRVGETYQGRTWDWDELAAVAAQLTIDRHGRNASQAGFEPFEAPQFGLAFDLADARRVASCFGGGSLVGPDGRTAQIPALWREAFSWYYDAAWKQHIVIPPNYSAFGPPDSFVAIGAAAMTPAWTWGLGSLYAPHYTVFDIGQPGSRPDRARPQAASSPTPVGNRAFDSWGMAVMPSWKGQTSSPMDVDTFTIPRSSAHPDQAFEAMTAIMADPTLRAAYDPHAMPARLADQQAWISVMAAEQAALFPGNEVDWTVLQEMSRYPSVPSHEADMPNATQALADIAEFYKTLEYGRHNNKGEVLPYDVNAELDKLRLTLQADFDAGRPVPE